jgi:hypothetical protein
MLDIIRLVTLIFSSAAAIAILLLIFELFKADVTKAIFCIRLGLILAIVSFVGAMLLPVFYPVKRFEGTFSHDEAFYSLSAMLELNSSVAVILFIVGILFHFKSLREGI